MNKQAYLEALDSATEQLMHDSKQYWKPRAESDLEGTSERKAPVAPSKKKQFSRSSGEIEMMKRGQEMIAETLNIPQERVLNNTEAMHGPIGFLNRINRNKREKIYQKRIKKNPNAIEIISEGDSWFQYPIYVKDIIDWLIKDDNYAINSLGAGGDWLANIFEQKEYIKALKAANNPRIFLVSGGGNDLLQDHRITQLLKSKNDFRRDPSAGYTKTEFGELLMLFKYLYSLLFRELEELYPDLHILIHGYDYAYPTDRKGPGLVPSLIHRLSGNGQWLMNPFKDLGYEDVHEMHAAVIEMIDAFNENQRILAENFNNVHYLDLRSFAKKPMDWHDEIHPSSKVFKVIAEQFKSRIQYLLEGDVI